MTPHLPLNTMDDTRYSPSSSVPGLLPAHATPHFLRSALEVQTSQVILIFPLLSALPNLTPFPLLACDFKFLHCTLWNSWFAISKLLCRSPLSEYLLPLLPLTETWLSLSNGTGLFSHPSFASGPVGRVGLGFHISEIWQMVLDQLLGFLREPNDALCTLLQSEELLSCVWMCCSPVLFPEGTPLLPTPGAT